MNFQYKIFISSTLEDLKEERDIVVKAILEMGHIPVTMEMFCAGDLDQWDIIKKQIVESDYFIALVALKYGPLEGELSNTEKEYDFAVSHGIPTLGFIISDNVTWKASRIERDEVMLGKLNAFKEKIRCSIFGYWDSKIDLYGKLPIALMKQFNINPGIGWVRADQNTGSEILTEISRLSRENSELRKEIALDNIALKREARENVDKCIDILKSNKRRILFYYHQGKDWEDATEFTLFEIFNQLGPELMVENSTKYCSKYLGIMLNPSTQKRVRDNWGTPSNIIRQILADLNVLELISPSSLKHKLDDENEYWSITTFGKEIYKMVRQEILKENLQMNNSLIDLEEEEEFEFAEKPTKKKYLRLN